MRRLSQEDRPACGVDGSEKFLMRTPQRHLWLIIALLSLCGCGPSDPSSPTKTRLQGAGATFPAPLYKRLVVLYQEMYPNVLIDYQSIGSGGGIRAITDHTVHFCGSDAPLNESELQAVGGNQAILVFPVCAGGVVPVYNVPGVESDLKFTGRVLVDMYLGKVSRWNDPAIADLNRDVQLPDLAITPVWRTDGSGTTFILTNYLATQSAEFASVIGTGKQVQWPIGQGGKGNEGVTAVVQQTAGGLGYVEQNYATNNHLPFGLLQNIDGNFVKASAESVSVAGIGPASKMEGNILTENIWNQPGENAYPIASFTYLIVFEDLKNLPDKESAEHLADFLWWAANDGQKYAVELGYAPLAPEVQEKVSKALNKLNYQGEPLSIGRDRRRAK